MTYILLILLINLYLFDFIGVFVMVAAIPVFGQQPRRLNSACNERGAACTVAWQAAKEQYLHQAIACAVRSDSRPIHPVQTPVDG